MVTLFLFFIVGCHRAKIVCVHEKYYINCNASEKKNQWREYIFFHKLVHLNERANLKTEINKTYIKYRNRHIQKDGDRHSLYTIKIALNFKPNFFFGLSGRSIRFKNSINKHTIWNEFAYSRSRYPQHRRYANRHIPKAKPEYTKKKPSINNELKKTTKDR